MARKIISTLLALSLVFPYVFLPPKARACGPFFPVTIFVHTKHPDLPLKKFAEGGLGVLQPTYARSYLVVAYRYLSGGSFSATERKQLLGLWAKRLDRKEEWIATQDGDSQAHWLQARKRITGLKDPDYIDRSDKSFPTFTRFANESLYYENCLDDAFLTAEATLRSRARQFGAKSKSVRSWVTAQDAVFNNCFEDNSNTTDFFVPEPATDDLPPVIRADREYQIAAAQFYSHHWEDAEITFSRIAQDQNSPWRKVSAVIAIRCAIRGASATNDPVVLQYAEARLRVLDANPSMRELRPPIRRLLGYLETRTSPEQRVLALARTLEKDAYPDNLYQDLADCTIILDRIVGDYPYGEGDENDSKSKRSAFQKTSLLRRQDDMIDWTFTYQSEDKAAASHAFLRWKERRTLPWLLAALTKVRPDSPDYSALRDAAAQISLDSKAYLTLTYQRARLLKEAGQVDEARDLLDKTLLSPKLASFPSARNAYLALRVALARTLAEFAQYASRQPSLVTSDDDGLQLPMDTSWCTGRIGNDYSLCKAARDQSSQFDAETAVLLTERLTTSKLVDLARQTELPANLRLQLAKATFVRATILGQETDGKKIAGTLKELAPALQDALEKYESAPSSRERQFAAFFLILRQPEMHPYLSAGVSRETPPGKIDNYRDNWWCDWVKPQDESYREFNYYFLWAGMLDNEGKMRPVIDKTWPAFLSETDRQIAQTEWSALARAGSAIETMGDPIIDWAKSRPDDPRVPEALHHLSRVYTYSCHDTTKNYSKITFQILHKRYPNSQWTKKTPYWF